MWPSWELNAAPGLQSDVLSTALWIPAPACSENMKGIEINNVCLQAENNSGLDATCAVTLTYVFLQSDQYNV